MNVSSNSEKNVVLSEEVIANIVSIAAMDVDGVCDLVPAPDVRALLKSKKSRAVRVYNLDDALTIDLFVKLKMGVKVASVCEKIQQTVKKSVQNMTNSAVTQVNVHVVDVDIVSDAADS